ncbi:MAG: BatA domain-containing protein [Polaribacter sp.]
MYFKNPDVLYFLFLLIIPILVHLFQLQKFVKTPFTNVAFLKKIKLETRKSANIKKWLILAIRMLSFLSILLSFSQPYLGSKNTNKKQDIFIYLDNSLSLNTKGKRGDLLKIATQDIIKFAPTDRRYTLQTNNNYYTNIDYNNLKNQLLSLKNTSKTTTINTVIFKKTANQKKKTKTSNKNILISDFQNTYSFQFTNVTPLFSTVILQSSVKENLSIDSLYFKDKNFENTTIAVNIKNEGKAKKKIPIAIYSKKQ